MQQYCYSLDHRIGWGKYVSLHTPIFLQPGSQFDGLGQFIQSYNLIYHVDSNGVAVTDSVGVYRLGLSCIAGQGKS